MHLWFQSFEEAQLILPYKNYSKRRIFFFQRHRALWTIRRYHILSFSLPFEKKKKKSVYPFYLSLVAPIIKFYEYEIPTVIFITTSNVPDGRQPRNSVSWDFFYLDRLLRVFLNRKQPSIRKTRSETRRGVVRHRRKSIIGRIMPKTFRRQIKTVDREVTIYREIRVARAQRRRSNHYTVYANAGLSL